MLFRSGPILRAAVPSRHASHAPVWSVVGHSISQVNRRAVDQPAPLPAVPLAPLILAGLLVLLAGLLAPERPADQAAICQRHAGAVACRVW